jgi:hypothetical protein
MRIPMLALLLAGLPWATLAQSAARIPAVDAPTVVRVGERYATAIPELPEGVHECELFLLPEDGSGRMIQLTPEREVDEGPLTWRMPPVHATRARLVLRAGGRREERESEPSAPFAIEAPRQAERHEVLRGEGELAWHFGEREAAGPASLLPPGATSLEIACRASFAAVPAHGQGAEPPVRTRHRDEVAAASAEANPSAPHPSRRPFFVPLRN